MKKWYEGPRRARNAARPFGVHRATDTRSRLPGFSLEAEHDSGRDPQIVLGLSVGVAELIETRQQVIDLRRTDGKTRIQTVVNSAANGHRKRILAVRRDEHVRASVRNTEQHLAKRCHAPIVMVRNAWTEEICRKGAARAAVENVAVGIAAQISHST